MKLTFCGAASEVTGSSFILETSDQTLMIDHGLFQGNNTGDKNLAAPPIEPSKIDYLLVTHAHLDHVGRIPQLVAQGFRGKILTLRATAELMEIVLSDEEQLTAHSPTPLFTSKDLTRSLELIETVDYHAPHQINDLTITFYDAGHILGSAWIEIKNKTDNQSIIFSGDLGNTPTPLLHALEEPLGATYVVMESTYGGQTHEAVGERSAKLLEHLSQTVKDKGVMLIPAFAIERTQEILYELNTMFESGRLPRLPIYLDSPMAIKATEVFAQHTDLLNDRAKRELLKDNRLFSFPGLTLTGSVDDSKKINHSPNPKLIIAGSGMMQGGRITHHAKRYLADDRNRLIFVGFQAQGTFGRFLFDRRHEPRPIRVTIEGDQIPLRATIDAIGGYSAHADQPHLLSWISGMKTRPKAVFLTHGEPDHMQPLAAAIEHTLKIKTVLPQPRETVEL